MIIIKKYIIYIFKLNNNYLISLDKPKSQILTILSLISIFSGFKSRWKNPDLCIKDNPYAHW